jgi:hypothetical protein
MNTALRISPPLSFKHTGLPPDCTVPILTHLPGIENSLGLHGSGFFVRRGPHVFFVTARHCLGRPDADLAAVAENLLIPYRPSLDGGQDRSKPEYVHFSAVHTAKSLVDVDSFVGGGDLDIAILAVAPSSDRNNRQLLSRAIKLPPSGDWFEASFSRSQSAPDIGPLFVRALGYPRYGTATEIDYENGRVITQGARLVARVEAVGQYPHSMMMRFEEEDSPVSNADGLSGGPVFLRLSCGKNQFDYYLAGMMINGSFPEAQFVTVRWFTDLVDRIIAGSDRCEISPLAAMGR